MRRGSLSHSTATRSLGSACTWSKWECVLLIGTHQITSQVFQAFFYVNLAELPELIRTGRLDIMLLLPVDAQFAVSTRKFGMDNIVNALVGVAIVIFSLAHLHLVPSVQQIVLYVVAIAFGVMVHYSVLFGLATAAFWIQPRARSVSSYSPATVPENS